MTKQIIGNATLYLGDCMDILPILSDVDSVITDPPYGMSFQSNRSKFCPRHKPIVGDDIVRPEFIRSSLGVLKRGGGFLMFCDWRTSCMWREEIISAGLELKSQVVWDREHHGMGDLRGSFAPQHDIIWYATKGRRVFVNGRPKSIVRCKRPSPSQDNGHPTCKPVELMEHLVKAIDDGSEGVVLDPFMGSGSTGVACVNLDRKFIGIELDPEYFDIACKRIEKAVNQNYME